MNGEAKQTKKLQIGAEKQGEWVTCAQKTPKSPKGFRRAFLRPGDGAGSQGVWSARVPVSGGGWGGRVVSQGLALPVLWQQLVWGLLVVE